MKTAHSFLAALLFAFPVFAQVPDTLKYSIPAPPVGLQKEAHLGRSVAINNTYAVVGAPDDGTGASLAGVVKVFDSITGALAFVLPNPSPGEGDNFGNAVAISGPLVVVGANRDHTFAPDAGIAYVYDLASATPTLPAFTLNNPSATAGYFGWSVAISGSRVVVGAPYEDTGANDAGSAYVYNLGSATPTVPIVTLHNPSPEELDQFGWSVGISATRVVVGADQDSTGALRAGSAYVYDLTSGTPDVPVVTINNPSPAVEANFGNAVGIAGAHLVVGAYQDGTGALAAGSAYVYNLGGGTPNVPLFTLHNPSPADYDFFGWSVAVSGTRVVVGTLLDDTGADDAGSAYVYDLTSLTPTVPAFTLNNPTPAEEDDFGNAVAVFGALVMVGAPADDTGAQDAGSAYLYDVGSATPTVPTATLNNPGPSAFDEFGTAVSVSGALMAVGAPKADSVFVYDLHGATPSVPILTLHNPGPVATASFGFAVAISGARVAVGAPRNSPIGEHEGSAYVYDLSSATPTVPVATLIPPTPIEDRNFGYAVAVSGTRVVVGEYEDQTHVSPGNAYVFDLSSATPEVPAVTFEYPVHSDYYGNSVAIDGSRVVVGVFFDDSGDDGGGAPGAGQVYVYDLSSGTPSVPVATLTEPGPVWDDQFGFSVSISGTRIAVGDFTYGYGSVFVFDLGSATQIVPVFTLNNPDPQVSDLFASAVSISGTRVVVGDRFDNAGGTMAGSAYVYDLSSATPQAPVATLHNPDPAAGDWFGYAVAIDGTTVAIGAVGDDTTMFNKGAVYVFEPEATPPDTSILTGPFPVSNSASATFTFTGTDDVTPPGSLTFETSLDGSAFAPATSPAILTLLSNSPHTFAVRAVDAAGNVDASPATQTWTVDTLPPETLLLNVPPAITTSTDATITFDASEPGCTFQAQFDGGSFGTFTNPINIGGLSVGPHSFAVFAVDSAGNADPSPSIYHWTVVAAPVALVHHVLFTKREPVPESVGLGSEAVWTKFGVPSLLHTGFEAGFSAAVKTPAGTVKGIFSGPFTEPVLRAKVGDTVTNAAGAAVSGVTFKSFKEPVFADSEYWAVTAKVEGTGVSDANDSGIWAGEPGELVYEVAREGAAAPGVSGATFKAFLSVQRHDTHSVVFTAKLQGSVTATNDFGLWAWTPAGGLVLTQQEGGAFAIQTYPAAVKSFKALQAVSGSPGHGRHDVAFYGGLILFADKTQAIVNFDTAGVENDVPTSLLLPGGVTATKFGVPCWRPGAGFYAVTATLVPGGAITTANKSVVLRDGFISAQQGSPAPGADPATFKKFKDPVADFGNHGLAYDAFMATLNGATATDNTGIWRYAGSTPTLELVAREGAEPPGAPGTTWKSFTSLSVLGGRGALFTAKLSGSDVTSTNDAGLWAEDESGTLRLIFREGGDIDGRTLRSFTVLGAVSGSPGQRRAWRQGAILPTVIWRAAFTDGTTAIVVTEVP
jgi:hypothetical protein